MRATAQTARRVLITGKGSLALVLLALAGCGGDSREPAPVERVREAIVGFGTTQQVRCEDAGAELEGHPVVRCGFEIEEDVSGAMKAQDRCYVVDFMGTGVVDVTTELPIGDLRSCTISAP